MQDAPEPAASTSITVEPELVVRRLYRIVVGREPDEAGLEHWLRMIGASGDPSALVAALLSSSEYAALPGRRDATGQHVLYHYNASFDAQEVMRRHAVANLQPHPDYLTNFLGVLINPDHFGTLLSNWRGRVEEIPIPANWHADVAEWGAALHAVDLAQGSFTMIELGCGWGCWMNNTGVAARAVGLDVHLIGVEGDAGHMSFAHQALDANRFLPSQVVLHHGIAAARAGTALFPRQEQSGVSWGSEPIFGASDGQRMQAEEAGTHDILTMIPLSVLAADRPRIDLLHIDIQGGEADLIADTLSILNEKVAFVLIGTHSRQIEGRLFTTLFQAGWWLEIERPAVIDVLDGGVSTRIDGVQGWRNPRLLPLA